MSEPFEYHSEIRIEETGMIRREMLRRFTRKRHPGRGIVGHQLRSRSNATKWERNPAKTARFCLVQLKPTLISESVNEGQS